MSYNKAFLSFFDNGTTGFEKLRLLQHLAIEHLLLAKANVLLISPESLFCNRDT